MASITIRNIEDEIKTRLRVRAAHHGRSMEDEAREILRTSLVHEQQPETHIVESIRKKFSPLKDIEIEIQPREPAREPPDFGQ